MGRVSVVTKEKTPRASPITASQDRQGEPGGAVASGSGRSVTGGVVLLGLVTLVTLVDMVAPGSRNMRETRYAKGETAPCDGARISQRRVPSVEFFRARTR
ncbi:hypothetical protein GCM10017778_12230 [Streptomyces vinaceus]|nr:hypothetical protein GCM10017778_12230 [Streptomyces vinaceus]